MLLPFMGNREALSMTEATVKFEGVTLSYGAFVAVKNIDLKIDKGSFTTLLGPSGCGKTTILRSIAGLVSPVSGEIIIAGRRINDVPIYKRNIGLVFQNYALFPHMTIADNIAFGLKYRNVPKAEIAQKVKRALDIVRLPGVEKKLPSQLSGGQQQRIALARAIVIEPDVLLLDEPLSALDANLREEMRVELKIIQREVGITTVLVTHDQEEALSLSDRIIVMNQGRIEQNGTAEEVYRQPASKFVASFLGQSNLLSGTVTENANGKARVTLDNGASIESAAPVSLRNGNKVTLVVRAQRLRVSKEAPASNALIGKIVAISYLGSNAIYTIDADGFRLQANVIIDSQVFREGDMIHASFAQSDCVLLGENGEHLA